MYEKCSNTDQQSNMKTFSNVTKLRCEILLISSIKDKITIELELDHD